ncbi:serine/threonine-protein kinase [Streptomyces sp. WMMB 322]|uniref:serine/threonine-protein kinase n=1 Tax=Streptomyces sp. WMMB 322 TaxID=1286821 RepID=UPI0006E36CCE|nr:serine/threonine-protein kinase [Streptomyces sp. WMMB 322]SCK37160.1 Serine/threonine protein kinase [Streptomyces sp. WMMB 322]
MTDEDRLLAGRYRLSRQLGRGGMGTVWLADDTLLDRHVAVKKLHVTPHLEDEELTRLYERTRREARSAARISHPGVIVVHDVVEEDGRPCIVMEYVHSRSLSDVLREDGPLPPEAAARTGTAMASALRAAHTAGVLHRDVKPANVLLSRETERVVLTDFGIAAASGTTTLTRTGEFVGSIDYAAPERMQGGESGPAADAWALGATLYEAVEGTAPFRRATWVETAYATASEPPRPMEQAGALGELIEALLAKDPGGRPTLQQAEEWLSGAAGTVALPQGAPWDERGQGPGVRNHDGARGPASVPDSSAAVPSPASSATDPAPAPAAPRRRGSRAAAWAVFSVAAVAAVAGGGWWLAQEGADEGGGGGKPGPSSSHSSGHSSTALPPRPPAADGYRRVKEDLGFSVDVPEGWKRQEKPGGQGVDFLDPSGRTGLTFSVLDFAGASPLKHWRQLEPEVRAKSPGYRNLRMNATTYQGRKAAVWEYTWQGRARTYHALDLGFGTEGERHYALYLSAPDAEWGGSKKYFDMAVKTFRVSRGG